MAENELPLLRTLQDSVLTLTLNRPLVFNALTGELLQQLARAVSDAARNPAVRCVVLAANGKGFCAGQDLAELPALEAQFGDAGGPLNLGKVIEHHYRPVVLALRAIEKPVLAAVQGPAVGAGVSLALACDLVVASDAAWFQLGFSKIGLVPDAGLTHFLPRRIGVGRCMELLLTERRLAAAEALSWGLVSQLLPTDGFREAVFATAVEIAALPTVGIGLTKRLFHEGFEHTLEKQLTHEALAQQQAGFTADFQEGVRAFREKCAPKFRGA